MFRVTLRRAYLKNVDLRQADLRQADLQGTDLRGANLEATRLEGAKLKGAKLKGCHGLIQNQLNLANQEFLPASLPPGLHFPAQAAPEPPHTPPA